jgi:predicted molibdopterin-dependent oxidoreductase YjgC
MSADGGPSTKRSLRVVLDGHDVEGKEGETILELARREHVYVPTLCFDPRLAPYRGVPGVHGRRGGARGPVASCTTPVREGMVIDTREPTALRVARAWSSSCSRTTPKDALAREGDAQRAARGRRALGVKESRYGGERTPRSATTDTRTSR